MHSGAFSDSGRCSKGCRRARQWRPRRWPGTAFDRRTPFRSWERYYASGPATPGSPSPDRVIQPHYTRLRKPLALVEDEGRPGSWDVPVVAKGIDRVKEWAAGAMGLAVGSWALYILTITAKALTPMFKHLPPVRIRRHTELIAKAFEGPVVVIILVPGVRGISGEVDAQLHEKTWNRYRLARIGFWLGGGPHPHMKHHIRQ